MDIIKISLLGVCGVILGFLMKGTKPEYACDHGTCCGENLLPV